MDKKLLIVLSALGIFGFGYSFYLVHFVPTECGFPPFCVGGGPGGLMVGVATAFILLLTLIIASIGKSIRDWKSKK